MTKQCPKCKAVKDVSEFGKDSYSKDKLRCYCKGCCKKYNQACKTEIIKAHKKYQKTKKFKKTRQKYQRSEKGKETNRRYQRSEKCKSRHRGCRLKRQYKITLEQYDKMFAFQGGVCAICGCPETVKLKNIAKRLSIDHNHITGKVRGLLCHNCNQALGLLGENPVVIKSLLGYIIKNDYSN